ncbi:GNAT family N-acetyltransferase [Vibrio hannami]|uniref:GNAT family N-acetyltransferase n=1 Tax=Vibrio hannami TaxID=2717094 RepID=UPI0024101F6B|nr:GNAT family N-acetyltransferase [Vibrio hannami]MDG3087015.1 GNAT family N-acetyltransferase [Vibrio hannami]
MTEWKLLTFDQLNTFQLYQLLKLRVDIFVVEQTCPYPELDNKDLNEGVYQLLGYQGGELVACARLLPQGISFDNVSIGRIATKQEARGSGLGHELMRVALQHCSELWPEQIIDIQAQEHLQAFYQQHGFIPFSESYLEDDIPHIDMRLAK